MSWDELVKHPYITGDAEKDTEADSLKLSY